VTVRKLIWITLTCVLLAMLACGGGDDAPPTATATPTPTASPTKRPTPTRSPTPTPSPEPTEAPAPVGVDLSGSQARQGGFLFVRYGGAATAPLAYFRQLGYTMQQQNGVWYTYIGLPTDTPISTYPLEVWEGNTLLGGTAISVVDGQFTTFEFEVPDSSTDLLTDTSAVEAERQLVENTIAGYTPTKYWSGPWIIPTAGEISSEFGEQRSANGGPYYPHLGLDIANEVGTPIYAAADGVVAVAQGLQLFGNAVIIDHGVGVFGIYGHMDSFVVAAGQTVTKGQLIGYMGQTGYVTGPHLHWEVTVHSVRVGGEWFTLGGVDP
jgi:murein DD-endopeptidase MepM/ murein hydrolase activator NlpD